MATSEKGGDEPPPYTRESSIQAERTNNHMLSPVVEQNRNSGADTVPSLNSRSQDYQRNDYIQGSGNGRRDAYDPIYRSDGYNGDRVGRVYTSSNQPYYSDPRAQQYPADYQPDQYERVTGGNYGPPPQAYNNDPRYQRQHEGYKCMQQMGGRPFGAQNIGRERYASDGCSQGRRHGGRREGGMLQRRRERKGSRDGSGGRLGGGIVGGLLGRGGDGGNERRGGGIIGGLLEAGRSFGGTTGKK